MLLWGEGLINNETGKQQLSAITAVVVALIIFAMQLNWVNITIDIGGMSESMLAEAVSHEAIWEAFGQEPQDDGIPYLMDSVNMAVAGVIYEIEAFINRLSVVFQEINIFDFATFPDFAGIIAASEPPDFIGTIDMFGDLLLLEVARVTGGMGEFSQSMSISDMPNVISLVDLFGDMIIRESAAWGVDIALQDMEAARTAEQVINMLRVVVIFCTWLMVFFLYLYVAGLRAGKIFGQFSTIFVFICAGLFALAMHFGGRALADMFGDYISLSAGWHVYAVLGLSALAFVLITVHPTKKAPSRYRR